MGKMWKKFWQWLQGWLGWFKGRSPTRKVSHKQQENVRPLLYQNYEFLFLRLLEGVAGGWQEQQVLEFLAEWENRTTEADWIAWLHSFGERTLSSKSPNVELGRRMLLLSKVACGELGRVAGEFGEELLRRSSQIQHQEVSKTQEAIAPYPVSETTRKQDANAPDPVSETIIKKEAIAPKPPPLARTLKGPATETKQCHCDRSAATACGGYYKSEMIPRSLDSLEGVLAMLKNNHSMVKQLAQQMGMQTTKPQVILRELEARAWMQEGFKYHNAENLSRAIECCDLALSLKADYQIAWAMRGDALFKLERYELAVVSYNKATEIKPDDGFAWYNQAMALFKMSRHAEAVESFQQSLKIKPDFAQAWKNLAIALFNLKLYPEAIASCEEALKIQPQDEVAISCLENSRAALRAIDDV